MRFFAMFFVLMMGCDDRHHEHGQGQGHAQEMHAGHSFEDAEKWAKRFESPDRDAWQKPDAVIASLGLRESDRVADIGSATGYFPVRVAKAVPKGKVWGIDVEPKMVAYSTLR